MTHDLEHVTAIAEAQHKANKLSLRRLKHRQRLERVPEADPQPWLLAITRDDLTDPELATVVRAPAEQTA